MEALELVVSHREIIACQMVDRGQRLGVMGGELREHVPTRGQQLARAGDVADIGVDLAREDREIGQSINLSALDLAVPVGPFDQPDHDPVARTLRQIDDPVDHIRAALAIGLHHEAQPVPAEQGRIERERFENIERDLQPVGFLGIDVEADIIGARQRGQRADSGQEFAHHPVRLRAGIPGMQRG